MALPSRRALASNGGSEYQVKVCYPKTGKCTTTSVWDVGPWNTKDDYWNPSSVREMWKTLPQGKPEAQAAYEDGFNGGLDQFGRRPANPAGIDIADGAFWTDLGMSNNDWVDVTYLWTSGGTTPTGTGHRQQQRQQRQHPGLHPARGHQLGLVHERGGLLRLELPRLAHRGRLRAGDVLVLPAHGGHPDDRRLVDRGE
ncbi:hypothetical protein ACN28S_10365 [Cystobacter fuscus]